MDVIQWDARKELALVLVKLGLDYPVALPDISTKAKAQAVVFKNSCLSLFK